MKREVEQVGRFERHVLPDGSEVFYDPGPHRYFAKVQPNKKAEGGYSFIQSSSMNGVSTPSKMLDTNVDPLLWWAARLDQEGIAELASLELDAEGDLDWLREQRTIDEALRDAQLTWNDVRRRAAKRGTDVHELIFLALSTDKRPPSLERLSAEHRGYGQSALKWWRESDPKPIMAEQATANFELGLAGRPDLLCEIGGVVTLVDAKTRDRGAVRPSDHVQLRGYQICNRACGYPEAERLIALILTPWGEPRVFECEATDEDFLCALDAYRRGSALADRIKAAEKKLVTA